MQPKLSLCLSHAHGARDTSEKKLSEACMNAMRSMASSSPEANQTENSTQKTGISTKGKVSAPRSTFSFGKKKH